MDYNTLLDLVADLGYRLAMSGAETFRVEESVNRITAAYGVDAEVFAIPNCLIVSMETADGKSMTRMRRIGYHGNNLDSVEKYSNLSRRICTSKPDPQIALQWLKETDQSQISYSTILLLLGHFLVGIGFGILFGCNYLDCFWAGLIGTVVGIVSYYMDNMHANQFFRTIIASFILAILTYILAGFHIVSNPDTVIISVVMLLVPGLLFTNALRDIIYGDTNSGINRVVAVFLIAVAIALGTAVAWMLSQRFFDIQILTPALNHSTVIQLLGAMLGCVGFCFIFNIHGFGILLCAIGGMIAWAAYLLVLWLNAGILSAYLTAAIIASLYAEIMARVRKYPAISYLVIAVLPFIPGASVYNTMKHAVNGDIAQFTSVGLHTVALCGVIAVGILLVSTSFRIWSVGKHKRK